MPAHVNEPISRRSPLRLIEAAACGNFIQLTDLIQLGANVNACDQSGRSALHLASAEGRLEIVEYLIQEKANIKIKDRWGSEPLHEACLAGHSAVINALVRAGAILSSDFKSEMEMKIRAFAAQGKLADMKRVIDSGFWYDAADYSGQTALHIASENNRFEIVEYLLKIGADSNAVDLFGRTPLMIAKKGNHRTLVELLQTTKTDNKIENRQISVVNRNWARHSSSQASFCVMEAFSQPIAAAMLRGRRSPLLNKWYPCFALTFAVLQQ